MGAQAVHLRGVLLFEGEIAQMTQEIGRKGHASVVLTHSPTAN